MKVNTMQQTDVAVGSSWSSQRGLTCWGGADWDPWHAPAIPGSQVRSCPPHAGSAAAEAGRGGGPWWEAGAGWCRLPVACRGHALGLSGASQLQAGGSASGRSSRSAPAATLGNPEPAVRPRSRVTDDAVMCRSVCRMPWPLAVSKPPAAQGAAAFCWHHDRLQESQEGGHFGLLG